LVIVIHDREEFSLSRVGQSPIQIPDGITVEKRDKIIAVKGSKGVLEERVHPDINVILEGKTIRVERPSNSQLHRSLHGLTRTLIQNMITGLTSGYEKKLEIVGIGYRAELKGNMLVLLLGYSHPIYFLPPDTISIEVPAQNSIVIKGVNKQLVGQVTAKIRSFRPPEPYKGKGIRYEGEHVRRKAGKAMV
jgi:large subunit ribosomal protein L6